MPSLLAARLAVIVFALTLLMPRQALGEHGTPMTWSREDNTYQPSTGTDKSEDTRDQASALPAGGTIFLDPVNDSDGNVTAGAGVTEPVSIPTTSDAANPVEVLDFAITDGGTSDGLALGVSRIVLHASGTADATRLTFVLVGPDAVATGAYDSESGTIAFSGLAISVTDGAGEVYTIQSHWNDPTDLIDGQTIILSVDGDTDFSLSAGGTQMGPTRTIRNSPGSRVDVAASKLVFTTQPTGSVSGIALATQPIVKAQDAYGNTDADFAEIVTLIEASPGSLQNNTAKAVNGVATFVGLAYTATVEGESFALTANDVDGTGSNLPTSRANVVTSDVVATRLVFYAEPAPTTVGDGATATFTSAPEVHAVDAHGITDTGYALDVTLAEANGPGSASIRATGDTDENVATVTMTPASGVATFVGLKLAYSASESSDETFNLRAFSGALTAATSKDLTATVNQAPKITDITDLKTDEDTLTSALAVKVSDAETAVGSLSVTASSSNPELVPDINLILGGSGANRTLTIVPAMDVVGTATITVTVSDGILKNAETFKVTFTPVNDAPRFKAGVFITPADGDEVLIGAGAEEAAGDESTPFTVHWRAATDVDGDQVRYTWRLATTADFAAPLLEIDADTATTIQTDYATLARILADAKVAPGTMAKLYHQVLARDEDVTAYGPTATLNLLRGTFVSVDENEIPAGFVLKPNYPNPFNPVTSIQYGVPHAAHVRLVVYDALGRQVGVVVDTWKTPGWYTARFEAGSLASGLYLYRLEMEGRSLVGQMQLIK